MIDLDLVLAHQLRVHLQFLGHPIANDPIYSEERIWVSVLSLTCPPCIFQRQIQEPHLLSV